MTEGDSDVQGERTSKHAVVLTGTSATRRVRRLDVQSDVGELCFALRRVVAEKLLSADQFRWLSGRISCRSNWSHNHGCLKRARPVGDKPLGFSR